MVAAGLGDQARNTHTSASGDRDVWEQAHLAMLLRLRDEQRARGARAAVLDLQERIDSLQPSFAET